MELTFVIRNLPYNLEQDKLSTLISGSFSNETVNIIEYIQGKKAKKETIPTRCYVSVFNKIATKSSDSFLEFMDNRPFVNSKGIEDLAIVESAPFKIDTTKFKKNNKAGTIESSGTYQAFLKQLDLPTDSVANFNIPKKETDQENWPIVDMILKRDGHGSNKKKGGRSKKDKKQNNNNNNNSNNNNNTGNTGTGGRKKREKKSKRQKEKQLQQQITPTMILSSSTLASSNIAPPIINAVSSNANSNINRRQPKQPQSQPNQNQPKEKKPRKPKVNVNTTNTTTTTTTGNPIQEKQPKPRKPRKPKVKNTTTTTTTSSPPSQPIT